MLLANSFVHTVLSQDLVALEAGKLYEYAGGISTIPIKESDGDLLFNISMQPQNIFERSTVAFELKVRTSQAFIFMSMLLTLLSHPSRRTSTL